MFMLVLIKGLQDGTSKSRCVCMEIYCVFVLFLFFLKKGCGISFLRDVCIKSAK